MSYQAPLRDMRFVLHELFDISSHCALLGNGLDRELIDGVLEEGARYAAGVIAPLNRNSDEQGCQLNDGQVRTPDGFAQAYQQYVDNGWASMTGPSEYGGQGLPQMLACHFHEMLMSASLSFRVYSGLTEGAVLALYKHGSDALKNAYLEKLVSGQWAGTMCLTEPQAGTDLALLRTRAEPQADGSYAVSGSKIFISGGEQDLSENIVHLVLARLPDAPAGVKGISLLLVPKFIAAADGTPGERNALSCGAIEHKMGIKGASTCVMNFDGATGWLVGEANQGLACMFTMMNDARFQVGLQGLGIGEAAFQGALRYARERVTDASGGKHDGISFLLIDMEAPGVTTRPITLISGSSPFCETRFDGVRVPARNLVGREHAGWTIAKRLLQHERQMISGIGGISALGGSGRNLEDVAREYAGEENGRIADADLRSTVVRHRMNDRAFQFTLQRAGDEAKAGRADGNLASIFKYYGTEQNKRKYELLLATMGSRAVGWEGAGFDGRELNTTRQWLRSKANSIEGGTSEVQLNVIAKRVLGLPD